MTGAYGPGSVLGRFERPAGEPTRFAVVADPHVATRASGTSKLFEHTLAHLEAAVADIGDRDVDFVLSPGDLTKDGEPWNYEAVDEALAALDVPFLAVPGNHDVPKSGDEHETPSVSWFADRYATGSYPFHVELGGQDVVGLNTSGRADWHVDTHDGGIDDDQLAWLRETLPDTDEPIILLHHNFPPISDQVAAHREIESEMALPPTFRDPESLASVLASADPSIVFSGHYHLPATGVYRGLREVAAPTTCSFPQSYLLCDVDREGTTVRLVPAADEVGLERGHAERTGDSVTSRGLTAIAAARLASFPLVDES